MGISTNTEARATSLAKRRGTAKDGERGYVLFTMAACMVVLCGFAGLVADLGYGEYTRRRAQAAADAGAKSAALEILANDSSAITTAAKRDTKNNGFEDQKDGVTVTVNHLPASGNYASMNRY